MLVTAAPCAIKGAIFDYLRNAIERREIYRERPTENKKALPLLALDARVLLTRGSTFCVPALLCIWLLAKLHAPSPALIRL